MTSRIESVKRILNPKNINAISGEINTEYPARKDFLSNDTWPAGPAVIAVGKHIPQISRDALVLFDSIILQGNVRLEKAAGVRRRTTISGDGDKPAIVNEYGIAMDYVTVRGGYIGKRSGIAHGSILNGGALGDDSFGNIAVKFGQDSVLPSNTYAFPLWNQPNGVTVPENALYVGDPDKPRALSLGVLNTEGSQWFFENNAPDPYPWTRPILVDGPEDPRNPYILTLTRRNIDPFQRTANRASFAALAESGVDAWLGEAVATPETHEVTRARWFHNYVPIRQVIKNEVHLKEDAARFGEFVWHSSQIQSETIHLSRLARILESAGHKQEAANLKWLVAANGYFLGIYKPETGQTEYIEAAYFNAAEILEGAFRLARQLPAESEITIRAFEQETVNSLFLPANSKYNGQERTEIVYTAADIDHLLTVIDKLPKQLATEAEITFSDVTAEPARYVKRTTEFNIVEQWIEAINPNGVNTLLQEDGNRVHKYHGLVPVIADDAILLGSDIAGSVIVGGNARLLHASVRSEQYIAPGYVNGTVEESALHTATNEQEPFYIHPNALILKAQVHGAEVDGYIADAVVADQSAIRGVVAPDTLLVKRDKDGWTYHAGNIGESFTPDKVRGSEKFIRWWQQSPFADLEPENVEAVQARVAELKAEHDASIEAALAAKVSRYGEIYRLSPLLQADALNIDNVITILDGRPENEHIVANLRDLKGGIEAILGANPNLNPSQATALTSALNERSFLSLAIARLDEIALGGETISIPAWPEAENGKRRDYDYALELVKGGAHPLEFSDKFKFIYGLSKDDFTTEQVINEQLHRTVEFYPEHIKQIAGQLGRIRQHIAEVREISQKLDVEIYQGMHI